MNLHKDANILVVDDNHTNLLLVEKILRNDGYLHVDCQVDPVAAVEQYNQKEYSLILLDVHMPVMTGFDVMAKLQKDFPDEYFPVLMLTADLSQGTRQLCLAAGAKDFVQKPFDRFEVLMRVRNILEVSLMHRQLRNHSKTLEEEVRKRTKQLYDAQIKIIQCLGKAAEYRDNETGMHVIRMSRSSGLLAHAMGLSMDECELILLSSPMHDIGKIAIPDSVLLKPDKLNSDEWDTMKSHAALGADILGRYDTKLMNMASVIAATHHERWDGGGYPEGLKGKQIPLYTRIVSVCDVFDALTSKRPYKEAWPTERAMDYLLAQRGGHFDPAVVDCFVTILDQILAVQTEYPDEILTDIADQRRKAANVV